MNFKRDNKSEFCKTVIDYGEWYVDYHSILILKLPKTFDDYWDNIVKKQARTEWRKANKNGCKFEKIYDLRYINDDILDIFHSQTEGPRADKWRYKKGVYPYYGINQKLISFHHTWPIQNYGEFTCPNHRLEFYTVKMDNKIVAYAEMVRVGELSIVHSMYGHSEYLKYGIMKFLIVELIKRYIAEGLGIFSYGFKEFLEDKRKMFSEQLGITRIYDKSKHT